MQRILKWILLTILYGVLQGILILIILAMLKVTIQIVLILIPLIIAKEISTKISKIRSFNCRIVLELTMRLVLVAISIYFKFIPMIIINIAMVIIEIKLILKEKFEEGVYTLSKSEYQIKD